MIVVMPAGSDIFASEAEALVNPVNCVGSMGKGLAKQFADRFPSMYSSYRAACTSRRVRVGKCHVFRQKPFNLEVEPRGSWIVNFPSQYHWREKSSLDILRAGLTDLKSLIVQRNIRSIAIPALGCGEGGLTWDPVFELLTEQLEDLDCEIELYPPVI